MPNPDRRGPRTLSEILGELFTTRGYGRLHATGQLEDVWNMAVGEPDCRQTRVGEVRRGILSVTVAHPTLLEELAAFRKPQLLEALRSAAPGTVIHDIKFRIGRVDQARGSEADTTPVKWQTPQPGRSTPRSNPSSSQGRHGSRPRDREHEQDQTKGKG